MTMPKQIDVKVTKPQNKHGQGRTRKCPIDVTICHSYYLCLIVGRNTERSIERNRNNNHMCVNNVETTHHNDRLICLAVFRI